MIIKKTNGYSLLLMLNPLFYFRLFIYMYTYNSTKLYINNRKKEGIPNTIVTWNAFDIEIEFIIDKIRILDADIVHLQGIYNNKEKIINELGDIYYNILINDHKQYYIYNDCGLIILSKFPIFNYNFIPFTNWFSKYYSGYIFYTINNMNFCNCNIETADSDKAFNKLQTIIKKNPYKDDFIIGGYIKYDDPYKLFNIKPNNKIYQSNVINNNYIISLNNYMITNNMYDFHCNENPIMGIINNNTI